MARRTVARRLARERGQGEAAAIAAE